MNVGGVLEKLNTRKCDYAIAYRFHRECDMIICTFVCFQCHIILKFLRLKSEALYVYVCISLFVSKNRSWVVTILTSYSENPGALLT